MTLFTKIKKTIHEGGYLLLVDRVVWVIKSFVRPASILSSFSHPISKFRGLPELDYEVKPLMQDAKSDTYIAERIIKAFNASQLKVQEHEGVANKDAWDSIEADHHKELLEILTHGDQLPLVTYLNSMHTNSCTYGISDLNENDYKNFSARQRNENLAFIKDKIVCLGEAVGTLPYKGSGGINMYQDTNVLVRDIQTSIGIDMSPSNIDAGLVKLKANGSSFCLRDLYSIYTAWRISTLVGSGDSVAEIGAGLGKAALYSTRFGLTDYSIFDLPQLNAIQSWYLIKSGIEVSLCGEEQKKHSVKILPWKEFSESKNFTITVNVDSFTEMSLEIVEDYLKKIKLNTTKYLLSINHEKEQVYGEITPTSSRLLVHKLVGAISGFTLLYRFPFWLRRGYIEEVYLVH